MVRLLVFLALFLTGFDAFSQVQYFVFGRKAFKSSSITVDYWEDFQFAGTVDSAALTAHDHQASGTYTLTGSTGTKLSTSSSGEQATRSNINGAADTSTLGLAYDVSGTPGEIARIDYNTPSTYSTISTGFWLKSPSSFQGTFHEYDLFVISDSTLGNRVYLKLDGNVSTELWIFTPELGYFGTAHNVGPIILTPDTWYWITAKVVKGASGTGVCKVYNTSGVQVGTEISIVHGYTGDWNQFSFAIYQGDFPSGITGNLYIDDVVADWTSAVYPLGP
jgi:hypothetical protein